MKFDILGLVADSLFRATSSQSDIKLDRAEIRASISFCDIRFGDFASNLALVEGKKNQVAARVLAESLVSVLKTDEHIESAEVAGPGFINIRLKPAVWSQYAASLTAEFYRNNSGQGKRINVEFISANPTGPLVLVNAWGGYYGDILARVFDSQGWEVTREYYLNNGGKQIAQLGRAIQQSAGKKFSDEESAVLYRGAYIDKLAQDLISDFGNADRVIATDPALLGDMAQKSIFEHMILHTLERLGIHHDVVTPETTLNNQLTLERLESAQAIKKYDGAIWLDGERAGLSQDEVLVRSNDAGESYFLKDISYQALKLQDRKYDKAITIVGPDHHGQEKRLQAALDLLGVPGFVPLWTQTVRLIKDGQEYKMSKRRGNFIELEEFLDTVPADTARFFFAMRDPNSHFDLDLDLVTAQNKHNPLYYVLYAYVRTVSVLAKIDNIEGQLNPNFQDQLERELWRGVEELDVKITSTITSYEVHPILHMMISLAGTFHNWYESHPVLKAETNEIKAHRVEVIKQFQAVLEGVLNLIGIKPIEHM